jgi:excinuclease UvrABC ATPase subunit
MPTLARPEVDVLEGLTTAIIVDQERMGANSRSTVGTATDANAMLRIVFSRLGQPHIGSPNAFSFNVPSVRATGTITIERGASKTVRQSFTRTGGMCPRCEGMGSVTDIDLTQLYDELQVARRGRDHHPRLQGRAAGTSGSTARRASSTRTSRSATTPRLSCTTSSTASRPG